MNNTKLELTNHGELDISNSIPLALNFNLNDIRDIRNRGGVWSKTIKLPGTNHNNDIFGDVFNVNINSLTFNQQVKEPVRVIVDGFIAFEGIFQIRKVNKVYTNSQDFKVEYDCYVKSDGSSFYNDISGKYLEDIDLSQYNHNHTIEIIDESMTGGTVSDGYAYYLNHNLDQYANYEPRDFLPAVYAKTYWDGIFNDAGYTYEWANSGDLHFDKLIIPYNGGVYKPKVDAEYLFKVGFSGATEYPEYVVADITVPAPSGFDPATVTAVDNDIIFTSDDVGLFSNTYDVYSTITGTADVSGFTGNMEFTTEYNAQLTLTIDDFTPSYPSVSCNVNAILVVGVRNRIIGRDALGNDVVTLSSDPIFEYIIENGTFTTTTRVNVLDNQSVAASAMFNSEAYPTVTHIVNVLQVATASNSSFVGFQGFSSIDNYGGQFTVDITSNGLFANEADNFIGEGAYMDMNKIIPNKVKQSDFILGIVNMYNLYITEDKYDPSKFIIRHRDEFYDEGSELDWTEKLNIESVDIELISNKQKKRKVFSYKDDSKDVVLEQYKAVTTETYGQLEYILENEFIKDIERVEPMFSPTVITKGYRNGEGNYMPYINAREPKNNPRILYLGDVLDGYFTYYNTGTGLGDPRYTYRYAGHLFPNPTASELDLNFGICDYYSFNYNSITNANLFNKYYRTQMNIFDTGHIMTAMFDLSYLDVANLEFNERIYVYDSWWNINKIIDFDLNNRGLTKVELVSSDKTIETFVPNLQVITTRESRNSDTNGKINKASLDDTSKNTFGRSVSDTLPLGNGNIIQSNTTNGFILGNGNNIQGSNAMVQGNDNVVIGDDITVLGVNGGIFTESGTTYVNTLVQLSSAAQDKTYQELVDMVAANELSAGSYYYLVDFETIYDRPDYTGVATPNPTIDTITGTTEPLLLMAISANEFADEVFSPTYPDDYIRYEFGYDTTYVNSAPAKGRIIERRDGDGNRTDFDHREITFKRYDRSGDLNYVWYWDSGADNSTLVDVFGAGSTEVVVGDTVNTLEALIADFNLPNSRFGTNCKNLTVGNYCVNNDFGNSIQSCTFGKNHSRNQYGNTWTYTTMGDGYADNIFGDTYLYNTFGQNYSSNNFGTTYRNSIFGNTFGSNTFGDNFRQNIFGNLYSSNVFGGTYENNKFGSSYVSNAFGNSLNENILGNDYTSNTIGTGFGFNTLGSAYFNNSFSLAHAGNTYGNDYNTNVFGATYTDNQFGNGYVDNTFGNNYTSNTFDNDFDTNVFGSNYNSNQFGNNFTDNTFGGDYASNVLHNQFELNTYGSGYTVNNFQGMYDVTIGDDVISLEWNTQQVGPLDLTSGNIIYDTYFRRVLESSDGNIKLMTINDAGTITMNGILD